MSLKNYPLKYRSKRPIQLTAKEEVKIPFLKNEGALLRVYKNYICYNGTCAKTLVFKRLPRKVVYIFFKSAREFGTGKVFGRYVTRFLRRDNVSITYLKTTARRGIGISVISTTSVVYCPFINYTPK